jgi:uncharacterized membrane protein YidH (DUF202 family)
MSMAQQGPEGTGRARKRAGVFDVRVIIGVLLGIYGVVLLLMGLFDTTEEELARTQQININLWTGIGLIIASVVFLVWARLRPVLVPAEHEAEERKPDLPGH